MEKPGASNTCGVSEPNSKSTPFLLHSLISFLLKAINLFRDAALYFGCFIKFLFDSVQLFNVVAGI
jgi:hypothetical protein